MPRKAAPSTLLVIRNAQKAVFDKRQFDDFVERTVAAIRRDLPEDSARLGDDALRGLVRAAARDGEAYGLTGQADVAGLAMLMVLDGEDFAAQPGNAWMRSILDSEVIAPEAKIGLILDREAAELEAEAAALERGALPVGADPGEGKA